MCAWCAAAERLLEHPSQPGRGRLTEAEWRERWEAERWFLAADGESGKRFGNETIRVTPDGEVSRQAARAAALTWRTPGTAGTSSPPRWRSRTGVRSGTDRVEAQPGRGLPHPLRRGPWPLVPHRLLARAPSSRPCPAGRGAGPRAWSAWTPTPTTSPPTASTRTATRSASRVASSTTSPGRPDHRDAQIRHALTRLLHWAKQCGVAGHRPREPGLHRREDAREARPPEALPAAHLRHPHRQAQSPAGVHGRRARPSRSWPSTPLTPRCGVRQHWRKPLTTQRRERCPDTTPRHRYRATRSRTPGPASDGTAPTRPE